MTVAPPLSDSFIIIDSSLCRVLIASDSIFEMLGFTLVLVLVGKSSIFSMNLSSQVFHFFQQRVLNYIYIIRHLSFSKVNRCRVAKEVARRSIGHPTIRTIGIIASKQPCRNAIAHVSLNFTEIMFAYFMKPININGVYNQGEVYTPLSAYTPLSCLENGIIA